MSNNVDRQYLDLLRLLLGKGTPKSDRTGTGTRSLFGHQMRFDLSEGFPLLTTKKVHLKSVIVELLWFLRGDTNIKYLQDHGVTIWNEWADPWGNLGPVYGAQWRNCGGNCLDKGGVDQIAEVIDQIKKNPDSRRLIVTAWNPVDILYMRLAPCHMTFQFYVAQGKLSCQLYQRSVDTLLGLPFNIASYALLTMMIAQVCDLELGDFVHTSGDVHLYDNHIEQAKLQLSREPRSLPSMLLNPEVKDIDLFTLDDFTLINYNPHPAIKAPVAI